MNCARSRLLAPVVLAFAALSASSALATPAEAVARLLAVRTPPPGVVFEVVSGDEAALAAALPEIRAHARALRERFPALPLAVLSHGSEQFSLLSENTGRYAAVHALVTAIEQEDGIPVQVCGNHASFRDKGREDFPAYVEVVRSAPSKLDEYRKAGYVVIVL